MPTITNLVFQGGSVKGIAYIGAMQHLDMTEIKRVAGTSAGAITAALLAVGCTTEEVRALLDVFDFEAVLDDGVGASYTRGNLLKTVEKLSNGTNPLLAVKPLKLPNPVLNKPEKPEGAPVLAKQILPLKLSNKFEKPEGSRYPALFKPTEPHLYGKSVKKVAIHRLYQQSGLYEGEYLRLWLEDKIQQQVMKLTNGVHSGEHLTFAELNQLTIDYPDSGFRDLKIIASNITRGEKKVFCCEDNEMSNVIISDAIRISMSIPFLFIPHSVYAKVDGVRCVVNTDLWQDGGLYDNYSIDCFDDARYLDDGVEMLQAEDGRRYNPQTLGFRLVSAEHKKYCEDLRTYGIAERPEVATTSFTAVLKGLIGARDPLQEERYSRKENLDRTVYIDHLGVSLFSFNLSDDKKNALVKSGEDAVNEYFHHQEPVITPGL